MKTSINDASGLENFEWAAAQHYVVADGTEVNGKRFTLSAAAQLHRYLSVVSVK